MPYRIHLFIVLVKGAEKSVYRKDAGGAGEAPHEPGVDALGYDRIALRRSRNRIFDYLIQVLLTGTGIFTGQSSSGVTGTGFFLS